MPLSKCGLSTCLAKSLLSAKWWSVPFFVTAALATGCAQHSTPPSLVSQCPEPTKVLVDMACPAELEPMADDSMGSLANALMSAAETYHACRAAALAL